MTSAGRSVVTRSRARALTSFPFSMFNLTQPRLLFLLSVEDEIRLEIDFRMQRPDNAIGVGWLGVAKKT